MAYADLDLETAVQKFEVARNDDTDLFEHVEPLKPSDGCATSGNVWKFLGLERSTLNIDRPAYYLGDAAKILDILVTTARGE